MVPRIGTLFFLEKILKFMKKLYRTGTFMITSEYLYTIRIIKNHLGG